MWHDALTPSHSASLVWNLVLKVWSNLEDTEGSATIPFRAWRLNESPKPEATRLDRTASIID
jgi:hypothetical protein